MDDHGKDLVCSCCLDVRMKRNPVFHKVIHIHFSGAGPFRKTYKGQILKLMDADRGSGQILIFASAYKDLPVTQETFFCKGLRMEIGVVTIAKSTA